MLRVIFDRIPKYINLASVKPADWDEKTNLVKKSHPNWQSINNLIKTKDAEAFDLLMNFDTGKAGLTPEKILSTLKGVKAAETFFDFFNEYVEVEFKKNNDQRVSAIESIGKNLWSFYYNKDFKDVFKDLKREPGMSIFRNIHQQNIKFHELTSSFLRSFAIYLKSERNSSERTVFNHMNIIRTVYNRAIDSKTISNENYPFSGNRGYSMAMPESQKIALEEHEVLALEKVVLTERADTWLHARNAWILSLCWGGARVSDVLKTDWTKVTDESLFYVMGKNNKPVEVPLVERAIKILNFYKTQRDSNNGYILPFLKDVNKGNVKEVNLKVRNATRLINDWLKVIAKEAGINKQLTNHLARHTFGNLAGDKIPIQTLQLIYRHSDIKTTINYQRNWMNKQKVGEGVKTVMNF
jgi:integrase